MGLSEDIRQIVEQVLKSYDVATLLGDKGRATNATGSATGAKGSAREGAPQAPRVSSATSTPRWPLPRWRSAS